MKRGCLLVLLLGCSKPVPPSAAPASRPGPKGESVVAVEAGTILLIKRQGAGPHAAAAAAWGADIGIWRVLVEDRGPRTVLSWEMRELVETEPSRLRRAAAIEQGEEEPEPLCEVVAHTGKLTLDETDAARGMLLPAYWERDQALKKNGGLWLSAAAFEELRSKRSTEWRMGLPDRTDPAVLTLEGGAADVDLKVLGVWRKVPVLRARSAGATVSILDDPTNPLILSVELGSKSAVAPIAPSGFFPTLLGYEIIEVR